MTVPRTTTPALPPPRRTVLVTGASGVVGTALLPRLAADGSDPERPASRVVALVHRSAVEGRSVTSVRGDITAPRLGLSVREYDALTRRVDAVVHAAAVTVFKGRDDALHRTNVDGTRQVLRFAEDAQAPLYHVSTAFLHPAKTSAPTRSAIGYAVSKAAAEDLVKHSGVPHSIVRPSIVIGDSRTGAISMFQGIYQVAESILEGNLPLLPLGPGWTLDLIPCDLVADAVADLVATAGTGRELWLTAGDRALTMDDATKVLTEHAASTGSPISRPRFVDPDIFDRLIAPAFLPELPAPMAAAVNRLMDLFHDYLALDEPFTSSVPELEARGVLRLPDSREAFRASLAYWAAAVGRTSRAVAVA
ncbi:MAG: SDR family oxidoreductase [Actinomycetes bacterium]